jgi:hypothetical protein
MFRRCRRPWDKIFMWYTLWRENFLYSLFLFFVIENRTNKTRKRKKEVRKKHYTKHYFPHRVRPSYVHFAWNKMLLIKIYYFSYLQDWLSWVEHVNTHRSFFFESDAWRNKMWEKKTNWYVLLINFSYIIPSDFSYDSMYRHLQAINHLLFKICANWISSTEGVGIGGGALSI